MRSGSGGRRWVRAPPTTGPYWCCTFRTSCRPLHGRCETRSRIRSVRLEDRRSGLDGHISVCPSQLRLTSLASHSLKTQSKRTNSDQSGCLADHHQLWTTGDRASKRIKSSGGRPYPYAPSACAASSCAYYTAGQIWSRVPGTKFSAKHIPYHGY